MFLKSGKFLFILLFLLFIPYFLKPYIVGYDSYAFVNFVCLKTPIDLLAGTKLILSILPCNLLVFKIIIFALTFVSLFVLKKTAEYVNPAYGWLAPLFLLSSPVWLDFLNFEDDQFSYPFLLIGLYFIIKYLKEKKIANYVLAIFFALIGLLFWKGSVYYLLLFLFGHPIGFAIFVILLFTFFTGITGNLALNDYVWENLPFIGIGTQYWLLLGYYSWSSYLFPLLFYWSFIVLLKSKFLLHLGFILAILCTNVFQRLSERQQLLFCGVCAGSMLLMSLTIFSMPINEEQHQAITFGYNYAEETGKYIRNDLKHGYFIESLGLKAYNNPGNYSINYYIDYNGVVVSPFDLKECELIKEFGQEKVYVC